MDREQPAKIGMFTRPKDKTILSFSGSPTVALARLLLQSTPGVQCSQTLLHSSPTLQTLQTLPPPRPFASVRFDPLAWSSGSDQRRISGCGIRWLLAGPDSLPLWLWCMCFCVGEVFFLFSHCTPQGALSGSYFFFSSLSSCKCCIFLQFYLHFTTDYTCMIVYVTNNKDQPSHHRVTCAHHKSSFSFFEQVVIALVHSCTFVCGFLCYQVTVAQDVLYSCNMAPL